MENIRPILYGVADYAQIRKKSGWFVDRTAIAKENFAVRDAVLSEEI